MKLDNKQTFSADMSTCFNFEYTSKTSRVYEFTAKEGEEIWIYQSACTARLVDGTVLNFVGALTAFDQKMPLSFTDFPAP